MEQNRRRNRNAELRRERILKKRLRLIGIILFVFYMAALMYFLFFADWYHHTPGAQWAYRYNIVPFREIRRFVRKGDRLGPASVFLNLAGNVLGFMPLGFFLPLISPVFRNGLRTVGLGFLLSLTVELVQLLTRTGCFDVDDIILNTGGALLGWLAFTICKGIRRNVYGG